MSALSLPRTTSLKGALQTAGQLVVLPYRTVVFVRKLLREGCIEVETPFDVNRESFSFRTLIQPDADVLNFIPPPRLFTEPTARQAFNQAYARHQQAVQARLAALSHQHELWGKLADGTLLVLNTAPLANAAYDFISVPDWEASAVTAAITAAISLLVRRFLRRNIFRLLIRSAVLLGRQWVRKRIKRATS